MGAGTGMGPVRVFDGDERVEGSDRWVEAKATGDRRYQDEVDMRTAELLGEVPG